MLIVTLLSDIGTQDSTISGAKVLLAEAQPGITVVDVTHRITPYNLPEAAYNTTKAYRHFPKGSVHLLMVDVFRGDRNRMLLAEVDGHYFIAPDNGLLSLTFKNDLKNVWLCKELSETTTLLDWVAGVTDIIAVLKPGVDPGEHLLPFTIKDIPPMMTQQSVRGRVDCHILHIDRYGNMVLNITKEEFAAMSVNGSFVISLPGEKNIDTLHHHYNEVPEGDLLCRFNSLGYLEIAVNHGSAAQRFKFDSTSSRDINYKVITIVF